MTLEMFSPASALESCEKKKRAAERGSRRMMKLQTTKIMISKPHYQEILDSLDERDEAIKRHNEQMAEKRNEVIEQATDAQRKMIQQALEALHKGNIDDVRRILEAL